MAVVRQLLLVEEVAVAVVAGMGWRMSQRSLRCRLLR
jgi:hypothetical protein